MLECLCKNFKHFYRENYNITDTAKPAILSFYILLFECKNDTESFNIKYWLWMFLRLYIVADEAWPVSSSLKVKQKYPSY